MNRSHSAAVAAHDLKVRPKVIPDSVRFGLLFVCCGVACTLAVVKPILGLGIIAGVVGICVALYLFAATLNGKIDPTILTWVLIFPLGYYFLSFPREKSIITLDRMLPIALLLAIGVASRERSEPLPRALRPCAIAWISFLVVAAASLMYARDILVSGRILVEGFWLPAILGWLVIGYFRVEENAATLHLLASLMALYVACIGAAEMVLKEDLLPLPGGTIGFAGNLVRPNGPFGNDDSFALIGLITFFLLLFLWNLLGENISFGRRAVHYTGLIASLAMALMPMFRSVAISLMVILLIATLSARKPSTRWAGWGLLLTSVLAVSLVSILAPETYEDRSSPDNVYGRLAEQMQTWHLFASHPVLGVGLGQFTYVVNGDTQYSAFYNGVRSVDSPHNTLGGILAETGILGFVPYVAAQTTLFLAFWRLGRKREPHARLAWTYFLYIFLGYWINGLSLESGYSSDLNLWFIFSITVLYKHSMSEKPLSGLDEMRTKTLQECCI
jgi:hypothetical protein